MRRRWRRPHDVRVGVRRAARRRRHGRRPRRSDARAAAAAGDAGARRPGRRTPPPSRARGRPQGRRVDGRDRRRLPLARARPEGPPRERADQEVRVPLLLVGRSARLRRRERDRREPLPHRAELADRPGPVRELPRRGGPATRHPLRGRRGRPLARPHRRHHAAPALVQRRCRRRARRRGAVARRRVRAGRPREEEARPRRAERARLQRGLVPARHPSAGRRVVRRPGVARALRAARAGSRPTTSSAPATGCG